MSRQRLAFVVACSPVWVGVVAAFILIALSGPGPDGRVHPGADIFRFWWWVTWVCVSIGLVGMALVTAEPLRRVVKRRVANLAGMSWFLGAAISFMLVSAAERLPW